MLKTTLSADMTKRHTLTTWCFTKKPIKGTGVA